MKVTLEFNDNEAQQAEQAYRGPEYAMAVEEFRSHLRNKVKYGNLPADAQREIDELYTYFHIIFGKLIPND